MAGEVIGQIGRGLSLLVGIASTETAAELDWMARKVKVCIMGLR
jgi:D-aminoacyl-tRNA deacylase